MSVCACRAAASRYSALSEKGRESVHRDQPGAQIPLEGELARAAIANNDNGR